MPTSNADPNRVILTGENPFIYLSDADDGPTTTEASFWRILFSPAGPGHVLYLKSELTDDQWRIYSDNIALARWLQKTLQGIFSAETADTGIPVLDADFGHSGDLRSFWTESVVSSEEELTLTWHDLGDPLLLHTASHHIATAYGVCTLLIPALGARLSINGAQAGGRPWPREREGRPFSSCALAFSESWTEPR